MIIAFAGLPGTGKTTLATALSHHLRPALLLNKDTLRHTLFGTEHTTYSRDQDDFCVELMLDTAAWQLQHKPDTTILLDGRTHRHRYQIQRLHDFADDQQRTLLLIECVCPAATARGRLAADHHTGRHPAHNRTPRLHDMLSRDTDPIPEPRLIINTTQPVTEALASILGHLAALTDTTNSRSPSTPSAYAAQPTRTRPC